MKCLIADLVTELHFRYDTTRKLAEPFRYTGSRETDLTLQVTDKSLGDLMSRAAEGVTIGQMENFALSQQFNRRAIRFRTMLVHSSALVCGGKAYLFSADSGVGKSFHTRLWQQAFGSRVHVFNDDKPVVRLYDDHAVAYGTPFDGGSGVALNEFYPLGAIVFIERGEQNAVRVPKQKEVLQKLYFQTVHMVSAETAGRMLENFEQLLSLTRFYVLTCNTDIEAAYTAYEKIVKEYQ